ncbi:MAG: hypothetical protein EBS76_09925 [Actinobacteria bacterium]|nr:hypothetical protein [Actinomycetota bacterium]
MSDAIAPIPDERVGTQQSERAGGAIPEGAITIAIGLIIAGIATYAFFRVGASALGGDEAFAPIAAMWFAMFALAPGFFLPIEQELGRALAHRRALGQGGRSVVTKVGLLTLIVSTIVVAALGIASPWVTGSYFSGDWWMFAALVIGFLAYAPVHLSRGICSGNGRFTPFAVVVASDGVMKILGTVILAAIGISAVGAYAFAVAIAPLFAVIAIGARGHLRTDPGPTAQWREISQNFGWLLLGTACAAVLLNAGPIAANILASESDADAVTRFGYGVLLASNSSQPPSSTRSSCSTTIVRRVSARPSLTHRSCRRCRGYWHDCGWRSWPVGTRLGLRSRTFWSDARNACTIECSLHDGDCGQPGSARVRGSRICCAWLGDRDSCIHHRNLAQFNRAIPTD